jgi:hypothetical protein
MSPWAVGTLAYWRMRNPLGTPGSKRLTGKSRETFRARAPVEQPNCPRCEVNPSARSIRLAPLANISDGKRVLPRHTGLELSAPHRANPSPSHRGVGAL